MMLGFMAAAVFSSATAQDATKSKPEPSHTSAREKTVINLWPGVAPGSEQWKQPETVIGAVGDRRIMNVSAPTLTAYLPDPSTATGTSVIIAPGGGFVVEAEPFYNNRRKFSLVKLRRGDFCPDRS